MVTSFAVRSGRPPKADPSGRDRRWERRSDREVPHRRRHSQDLSTKTGAQASVGAMGMGTSLGAALVERPSAHDALEDLFQRQYVVMVRAARVLLRDPVSAEDIVQEAFVRLHGRLDRLAEPDRAVAYLRSTVLNLARSRVRRLVTARRHAARLSAVDRLDDGAGVRAEQ